MTLSPAALAHAPRLARRRRTGVSAALMALALGLSGASAYGQTLVPEPPPLLSPPPLEPPPHQHLPGDAAPEAADPALSAAEFDALTQGRTMDTHDAELGLYGVETFLPGQKVVWRDAERCMGGSWEQVGDQICFSYEDKPNAPVCWTYHDRGGWIQGWYQGRHDTVPIMLYPAQGPLVCEGFVGV